MKEPGSRLEFIKVVAGTAAASHLLRRGWSARKVSTEMRMTEAGLDSPAKTGLGEKIRTIAGPGEWRLSVVIAQATMAPELECPRPWPPLTQKRLIVPEANSYRFGQYFFALISL
jgi:hypothetical protein